MAAVAPISMDTAVLFYPRGGSAQVIRYLLLKLNKRGLRTRLMAGTLGSPGVPSNASTFYQGLDLHAFDYNPAQRAFEAGADAMAVPFPFHPSYEDRGHCPDIMFSAVSPGTAMHLTRTWRGHLAAHRSLYPRLLHLHHLSHLQYAARVAYPDIPVVTTLHGTELKLIDGMTQRIRLAERIGLTMACLAHELCGDGPGVRDKADRISVQARLTEEERSLLRSTRWEQWKYSHHWLGVLHAALSNAGTIVAVSEQNRALACQLLPVQERETSVISNGVDTEQFRPEVLHDEERMSRFRRWLVEDPRGWRPGCEPGSVRYSELDLRRMYDSDGRIRPVLMWVGRFLDFKRVPVLLEAFAWMKNRLQASPILLMWGGYPGEYEGVHPVDLAESLAIDQDVFFLGWRDHAELSQGLNCVDIMVAPAVHEPFGMVYIESMACGIPPIATATGGPLSTITPSGSSATGWTVKPDSVVDLGKALIDAISCPAERMRRGRNGIAQVRRLYDWEIVADRYMEVYARALGG